MDHLVPAVVEVVKGFHHGVRIVVQIADEHDQTPLFEAIGQLVKRFGHVRLFARLDLFELPHHLVEVPRRRSGGHVQMHLRVERRQPHRVLLPRHQIRQNRRQIRTIVELRDLGRMAVAHRRADVQEDLHPHVRLFFILLDVETFGAGEHFVVEMARVVAGRVFAVFGEFDAEPLIRTGVQSGDRTFDHSTRYDCEVLHAGQGRRLKIAVSGVVAHRNWNLRRKTHSTVRTPTNRAQNPGGQ
jgi:hypothetical protein